jgi:proteic killer suppression protein
LVTIRSWRHPGLREFFEGRSERRIEAARRKRIRLVLALLNAAKEPRDMDAPGLRLHPLKGGRKGTWAVDVSGNWRITFAFSGEDAVDVDLEDYH